jgi:hypothetical protein
MCKDQVSDDAAGHEGNEGRVGMELGLVCGLWTIGTSLTGIVEQQGSVAEWVGHKAYIKHHLVLRTGCGLIA